MPSGAILKERDGVGIGRVSVLTDVLVGTMLCGIRLAHGTPEGGIAVGFLRGDSFVVGAGGRIPLERRTVLVRARRSFVNRKRQLQL
jgi:hypothetical protein